MRFSQLLAASRNPLCHSLPRAMASQTHDIEDGQVLPQEKDMLEIDADRKATTPALKLDKHGLPLVPQPSDHKDDPLVSTSSEYQASRPNGI